MGNWRWRWGWSDKGQEGLELSAGAAGRLWRAMAANDGMGEGQGMERSPIWLTCIGEIREKNDGRSG